jgi:hypothetical protein
MDDHTNVGTPIDRKEPVLLDDYVFHPNSGCIPQP